MSTSPREGVVVHNQGSSQTGPSGKLHIQRMSAAPEMPEPLFRPRLLADGVTDAMLRSRCQRSELSRIRPGAYAPAALYDELEAAERRRLLIQATIPKLDGDSVVSHISAARLLRMPVPDMPQERVHVSRHQRAGGFSRANVHCHATTLAGPDVQMIDGVLVTSAARTVVDCACLLDLDAAVCLADDALHRKLTTEDELEAALLRIGRRVGVRNARLTLEHADGLSESVGESLSRMLFLRSDLPAPWLQVRLFDGAKFLGRPDFLWKQFRTVGEFDGKVKYGRLLKPGQSAQDAAWAERQREIAISELNWEFVRWTWADLAHPEKLRRRVLAAFARGMERV